MSSPSSPKTICTRTEDWRCHEQVRHIRSPNCSYAQSRTSSADIASTSGSWSAGTVAKQLLLDPPDPLVGSEHDFCVLRAHLGEDGEVARQIRDQLELALPRDVDDAVGDLDVRQPECLQPALVVVHLVLRDHRLEEGSPD